MVMKPRSFLQTIITTPPCRKSNANVVMMQAAGDGPCFDAPEGVNWSPRRRILVQGQACSAPIVSSSHNSAADGEGGALPRQSRDPNSPVGSNRSPIRNIRSARVSGPQSADLGCPSPGYGSSRRPPTPDLDN